MRMLKTLVLAVGVGIAGCAHYPPRVEPMAWSVTLPDGLWYSNPKTCPYVELGMLAAEAWTRADAVGRLGTSHEMSGAHATVDVQIWWEVKEVPYDQCREIPGCRQDYSIRNKVAYTAPLYTAQGLAVRWECEEVMDRIRQGGAPAEPASE